MTYAAMLMESGLGDIALGLGTFLVVLLLFSLDD